jgi:hypothetical protein
MDNKTLESLRGAFESAGQKHDGLKIALIHWGEGKRPTLPPEFANLPIAAEFGSGADKWAILTQKLNETLFRFQTLANEAAIALPGNQSNLCWRDWVLKVFETSNSPKHTWLSDGVLVPYDKAELSGLAKNFSELFSGNKEFENLANNLPDYWVQKIDDVFLASCNLINSLTTKGDVSSKAERFMSFTGVNKIFAFKSLKSLSCFLDTHPDIKTRRPISPKTGKEHPKRKDIDVVSFLEAVKRDDLYANNPERQKRINNNLQKIGFERQLLCESEKMFLG